jgi:dephospho-CoA kinase
MVCVDAPAAVRFERLTARGRLGDVQTLEEFEAQEARELHTDDPTTQQLLATEAKATHRIDNSGGLEALKRAVDSLLGTLS